MICPACREAARTGLPHVLCAGDEVTALPGANARTWCDCQHVPAGATKTLTATVPASNGHCPVSGSENDRRNQ